MQIRAIHQFSTGCSPGDGITNGMLFTRRLLNEAGIASTIYSADVHPELTDVIEPKSAFQDSPDSLLLIHHGISNLHEDWLRGLQARKLMVFHNITPGEFFADDDPIQGALRHGWKQVDSWKHWLDGAIADSAENLSALLAHGYEPERCQVIPLLVDLDKLRRQIPRAAARAMADEFRLLFVGRLVPHKNQLGLVETLHYLHSVFAIRATLVLVGSGNPDYESSIRHAIDRYGLGDAVTLTGKISDEELAQHFAQADLYLSLSRHEGFGMPLVEAMAHGVPVVAFQAAKSNIATTVGAAGMVLTSDSPKVCAATIATLVNQPRLRRQMVINGFKHLDSFQPTVLLAALWDFLHRLGFDIQASMPASGETGCSNGEKQLDFAIEGPFDSSYSLAIVNRELALALAAAGTEEVSGSASGENTAVGAAVGLFAAEGGGSYNPDRDFIASQPSLQKLYQQTPRHSGRQAQNLLRLMYPLRLTAMQGVTHIASCYGWEESRLPESTVRHMNFHSHLVTTMSSWVSKTLVDNGVSAPVATVGIGADHILRVTPDQSQLPYLGSGLRFLHISSCFPRKGVDVLLASYGRAFTAAEDVTLVIKTFANPHHCIESTVARWRQQHPNPPAVVIINQDMPDAALRALYQRCHVLVAPSRGEGFGLPLAEAMLHQMPVVTTGYGGQMDFCSDQTAWLVDYTFAPARSHMVLDGSLWVEPSETRLAEHLSDFYSAWQSQTSQPSAWQDMVGAKTAAAKTLIESQYSWRQVAKNLRAALCWQDQLPSRPPQQRRGWVTTWNARCGIATYSQCLIREGLDDIYILANTNVERLDDDGANVRRCWQSGQDDDLKNLYREIVALGIEQVVIQFNFSLYRLDALGELLTSLQQLGIQTILTLHSSADVWWQDQFKTLRDIFTSLKGCTRILVHTSNDLNRLKDMGLVENSTLIPHGVALAPPVGMVDNPVATILRGKRVIASYGFLLPHKGIFELIEAFSLLAENRPELHLLLVNAQYPTEPSSREIARCQQLVKDLELEQRVTMVTEFLDDSQSLAWLELAEMIVFPYQHTNESASGAVRWGLATGKPILCTPLGIFDDIADVAFFCPEVIPPMIAEGIARILNFDESEKARVHKRQQQWLQAHAWGVVSKRLQALLDALAWEACSKTDGQSAIASQRLLP
ncbi:MAG: glycosyltransferase [Porticoccaceae bacterium]|nr:glycosyltransferase [Porticoccaceae bacterium]